MEIKKQKLSQGKVFFVILMVIVFFNVIGSASAGTFSFSSIIGVILGGTFWAYLFSSIITKSKAGLSDILKGINVPVSGPGSSSSNSQTNVMEMISQAMNESKVASTGEVNTEDDIEIPTNQTVTVSQTTTVAPQVPQILTTILSGWTLSASNIRLSKKKRYLQVALNGSLAESIRIISQLPQSDKIIIEVGTPLIKISGVEAVRTVRRYLPGAYIVADSKIADLASREVELFKNAGANGITALGVAPIECLDEFVSACRASNMDAMIDMMNVESSIAVLKKLKNLPEVVVLHRGVDETEKSQGKAIPYYQINQVKGNYNLMVAVAGGDTSQEIQSAVFNGADIVVVWKDFMTGAGVRGVVESFLKEIK